MHLSVPPFLDFQPYLLPGTDSWALSEEKAIGLLNYLKTRGVEHIYCMPPVRQENPENTPDFLQKVFRSFQQRFPVDCELKLAARYRLDDGFMPLLKSGGLLSVGKHLLIDVSPLQEHKGTWEMIGEITDTGYIPIVIQPERVTYWEKEDFVRLKESGARMMMNLYSLFGHHGDYALMHSRRMVSEGMYDYMCSGMEDTKIMRYSENFTTDAEELSEKELNRLEENGRLLWENQP